MVQHAETYRSPGGMHWKILKVWRFRGRTKLGLFFRCTEWTFTNPELHEDFSCCAPGMDSLQHGPTIHNCRVFSLMDSPWIPSMVFQTDSVGGRVESTDQCLLAAWLTMVLSPWFAMWPWSPSAFQCWFVVSTVIKGWWKGTTYMKPWQKLALK